MNDLRRILVLFGWQEQLTPADAAAIVKKANGRLELNVNKVSFQARGAKEPNKRIVTKNNPPEKRIEDFGDFRWMVAEKIFDNNFLTTQNCVSIDLEGQKLKLECSSSQFSDLALAELLKFLFDFVTPFFGFADYFSDANGRFFSSGIQTTTMSTTERRRVDAFSAFLKKMRRREVAPLTDLFPLTILSPGHMETDLGGKPLRRLITEDKIGGTKETKSGPIFWVIEPQQLVDARKRFFPEIYVE
jgi:hypothetical protein